MSSVKISLLHYKDLKATVVSGAMSCAEENILCRGSGEAGDIHNRFAWDAPACCDYSPRWIAAIDTNPSAVHSIVRCIRARLNARRESVDGFRIPRVSDPRSRPRPGSPAPWPEAASPASSARRLGLAVAPAGPSPPAYRTAWHTAQVFGAGLRLALARTTAVYNALHHCNKDTDNCSKGPPDTGPRDPRAGVGAGPAATGESE